jgi:hypothetical protein
MRERDRERERKNERNKRVKCIEEGETKSHRKT